MLTTFIKFGILDEVLTRVSTRMNSFKLIATLAIFPQKRAHYDVRQIGSTQIVFETDGRERINDLIALKEV